MSTSLISPRTWSIYTRGTFVLVLLVCVFRAWTLSQWSWYADDWGWFRDRASMPAADFIFRGYNSHLMPGQFALMWVMGALDPLDHSWATLVTTVLAGTTLVAWAIALRELFGERPHLLAGVALIGLTPLMTGVSLWWASALQNYVIQAVMGLSVWWLARWLHRDRRRSDLVGLAATFAIGLFMWEKCLLVAIPLPFVVMVVGSGSVGARLHLAARAAWPVALISAGYLGLYLGLVVTGRMGPSMSQTEVRQPVEIAQFFWHAVADMALPVLVGGPFVETGKPGNFYPPAGPGQTVILVVVLVVALGCALRFRRRGGWAVGLAATYGIVALGLVLFNQRFQFFGNDVARTPSYWPDIVAVLVLAGSLLTTTTLGDSNTASWRGNVRDRAMWSTVRAHAATVLIALCVVGSGRAFGSMAASSPAPFWDTLRADAEKVGAITINDSIAPPELVGGIIVNSDGTISSLLAGLDLPISFNTPTDRYAVVNGDGHLVLGRMRDDSLNSLPTDDPCGYGVTAGETTEVPLDRSTFGFGWIVEMTYFTETDAVVKVRTDETSVEIAFPASTTEDSIRTRQFHIEGPVSFLEVSGVSGLNDVCITESKVGLLEPTDVLAVEARSGS